MAGAFQTRTEYYTNNLYLFKKLISGIFLYDPELFLYTSYPLMPPQNTTVLTIAEYLNNTTSYSNYTGFTYGVSDPSIMNNSYFTNVLSQMTIMNVYYPAFNITFNNITIQSYFVAFQNSSNNEAQLIVTYPAGYNKLIPDTSADSDNWYTRAVSTTGDYAFYFSYSNNRTILTISQELEDSNQNTIGVVGLDLDMENIHYNLFYDVYAYSNSSYSMALVDQYGSILNFPTILNLSPGQQQNYFYNICGLSNDTYNIMVSNTIIGTSGAYSAQLPGAQFSIDAIRLNISTDVDPYYLIGFFQEGDSQLLDTASDIVGSNALGWFMVYAAIGIVALFIIMMFVALVKSTTFLEPLTIISRYAIESGDQSVFKAKKDDKEKDKFTKEISKLEDGSDEVGELVKYFRRLIKGLNALKRDKSEQEEEDILNDHEEHIEYPRNFLKSSRMPWRDQLKQLIPKAMQQSDDKNKNMDTVMSMFKGRNNILNKPSL